MIYPCLLKQQVPCGFPLKSKANPTRRRNRRGGVGGGGGGRAQCRVPGGAGECIPGLTSAGRGKVGGGVGGAWRTPVARLPLCRLWAPGAGSTAQPRQRWSESCAPSARRLKLKGGRWVGASKMYVSSSGKLKCSQHNAFLGWGGLGWDVTGWDGGLGEKGLGWVGSVLKLGALYACSPAPRGLLL